MRQHVVGWAAEGQLLFRTWAEGLALFFTLVRHFPGLEALCAMPHHAHVLGEWADAEEKLVSAQSAYARWRNARRAESGPVWARHPEISRVVDDLHARRTVRYIHLNPVRDHLVGCPLAWPLSTHRDGCGLVVAPVVPRAREPEAFHRYVSSDPDAEVLGTPFPELTRREAVLASVLDAASAVGRFTATDVRRRGPARELCIGLASLAGVRDARLLGAAIGASRSAVSRQLKRAPNPVHANDVPGDLRIAATVLDDSRFFGLAEGDLLRQPSWRKLRNRR